jgi:hypothetical protein
LHVFDSADRGSHWREQDQGLGVHPHNSPTRLIFAPSDPQIAYIVSAPRSPAAFSPGFVRDAQSTPPVMYASMDGGQTWQPRLLPISPGNDQMWWETNEDLFAVDPIDPARLFFVAVGSSSLTGAAAATIWETRDSGATWMPHASVDPTLLTSSSAPLRLLVTHRPGTSPALYVELRSVQDAAWYRSLDLGATWHALPLPSTRLYGDRGASFLLADPTDPNTLVWASVSAAVDQSSGRDLTRALDIAATRDGFRGAPLQRLRIDAAPTDVIWGDSLQVDKAGDFFLALRTSSPSFSSSMANEARILAFRPSALGGPGSALGLSSAPPSSSPTPPTAPFSCVTVDNPGATCPNKPPEPLAAPVQKPCDVTAGNGGAMAFDGRFIDFTNDVPTQPGQGQATAGSGVSLRIDSACRLVAPLTLQPADFPSGRVPPLASLTYAATFTLPSGRQGALMASAPAQVDPRVPATDAPIYAIDPVTATATLVASVDVTADGRCARGWGEVALVLTDPCADLSFFSFDVFRKGLWSMGGERPEQTTSPPRPSNGFLAPVAMDGAWHGSCFGGDPIAAVVGGDGYLYVQSEDDVTVYRVRADDCSIVGGFSHPYYGENPTETEQLACDPLSFGVPTIWVRNSVSGTVAAYPAPEAVCPFPTKLAYTAPLVSKPGAPLTLCFTLSRNLDGQWDNLPAEPITVTIAGASAGQAMTNQVGQACLETKAPVTPGAVPIRGTFAGTNAYLPSSADGPLLVLPTGTGQQLGGVLLPQTAVGGPPPPPQSVTGTQPNGAPGAEPVGSVTTQVESQAQAQSQSQAQAQSAAQVQPGVMVQRQKRTQIATQEQTTNTNMAYEARALRHARPAPVVAIAMGLMMLGFGLAAPRTRWALARLLRRRR